MGHGVRSALVTAMVRALVEELRPVATNPGQLLDPDQLRSSRHFATDRHARFSPRLFTWLLIWKPARCPTPTPAIPSRFWFTARTGDVELLKNQD